jgi:hypothetical protein
MRENKIRVELLVQLFATTFWNNSFLLLHLRQKKKVK